MKNENSLYSIQELELMIHTNETLINKYPNSLSLKIELEYLKKIHDELVKDVLLEDV